MLQKKRDLKDLKAKGVVTLKSGRETQEFF